MKLVPIVKEVLEGFQVALDQKQMGLTKYSIYKGFKNLNFFINWDFIVKNVSFNIEFL